jgi:hypothetical protein
MRPKGKMPWNTLNGEEHGDSMLCVELLYERYDKDISSHLTAQERAVAKAFQLLVGELLYW